MTTHIASAVVSVTIDDLPIDVEYDNSVETFDESVERAILEQLEKRLVVLDFRGACGGCDGIVKEINCEHADWNAV